MKSVVLIALWAAGVLAYGKFEPKNFDAGEALMIKGVNISQSPASGGILSNCQTACDALRRRFGSDLLIQPSDISAYSNFSLSYWSAQQRSISPRCIFKPQTPQDVSVAILTSRQTGCPFAAKSGGHSTVPGGSNIEHGITISFELMNKTVVSADKMSVTYEPGQTWRDVYSKLQIDNITIIGGRAASVGVGGLTLGGGISYFSNVYGLACDNVISYEVVTASGRVLNVSSTSYPDLYFALRGGGNNFGLVTKFHVRALERDPLMWGGIRIYTPDAFPALMRAYYNLGFNVAQDGKAHQILSFVYGGPVFGNLATIELEYEDPTGTAPVLSEFNTINGSALVSDGTGINTLVNLTTTLDEISTINGLRQLYITWTAQLDLALVNATQAIFYDEIGPIADAADVLPSLALQVISEPMRRKTAQNGGNPLGLLDADSGPLMLALLSVRWSNATDDARINTFAQRVQQRAVAAAEARGKASRFLYMNYGNPVQDIIASYGPENKARLQQISKKYDPEGVFEKLQPGYFKLNGAPAGKAVV